MSVLTTTRLILCRALSLTRVTLAKIPRTLAIAYDLYNPYSSIVLVESVALSLSLSHLHSRILVSRSPDVLAVFSELCELISGIIAG